VRIAPTDGIVLITAPAAPSKSSSQGLSLHSNRAASPPSSAVNLRRPSPRRSSRGELCGSARGRVHTRRHRSRVRAPLRGGPTAAPSFFDEIAETPIAFHASSSAASIQKHEIRRSGRTGRQRRCPDSRGRPTSNQSRGGRRETLPAGPLLPPQRRPLPASGAPGAARGPHPLVAPSLEQVQQEMGVQRALH